MIKLCFLPIELRVVIFYNKYNINVGKCKFRNKAKEKAWKKEEVDYGKSDTKRKLYATDQRGVSGIRTDLYDDADSGDASCCGVHVQSQYIRCIPRSSGRY